MKLLIAASILTLGAGLAVAPAVAEEEPPVRGSCSPAQLERLQAEGDNFADACFLPGQEIAEQEGAEPVIRSGEIDKSDSVKLIANLPLEGDFAGSINSDIAFKGNHAYAGNYNGFAVYDIRVPSRPTRVAQVTCPGSQNDISVYQDLLILSVDSTRSNDTCENTAVPGSTPGAFEGIRVFDISNPASPQFLTSVKTACGSHTHSLAPGRGGQAIYAYVSSYSPSATLPNCQPPHDSISIVKIPLQSGENARVVKTPVLFPGGGTTGDDYSSDTSGCHDITVFPKKKLAAGACMGDGILMNIEDPTNPRVISRVRDTENFAFWHSATFNNAGTKVVFTDELGGGGAATCNPEVGKKRGANGIYDIVKRKLVFRSYYKMPRTQSNTENCVAHNGSLVPIEGRDIMVQAWYQGGTSVFDFTNSAKPREIAHFDRGAINDETFVLGGSWSSYWYNGRVYSNDITRGLEVFRIYTPWAHEAGKVKQDIFNAQSQPSYNG